VQPMVSKRDSMELTKPLSPARWRIAFAKRGTLVHSKHGLDNP
jgi:hypothetical protein